MALVGNISGSTTIGITGSVIIASADDALFPALPGIDTTFFVSGSSTERSVFGGDVVISGTLNSLSSVSIDGNFIELSGSLLVSGTADFNGAVTVTGSIDVSGSITANGGISGSLTTLSDGSPYIVAGNSQISITTASNGSIEISGNIAQSSEYFFSSQAGSIYTTGSTAFSNGEGVTSPAQKGADVFFYVSGSIGTISDKSLFGGDVFVSGGMSVGAGMEVLAAGIELTGSLDITGSLILSGPMYVSGPVSFDSNMRHPEVIGSDVFFYVSGSMGSAGSTTRGTSLFGGDVVVSGSLNALSGAYLAGDTTEITGDELIVSGTLLVSGAVDINGDLTVTGSIYSTNGAEFGGSGLEISGSLLVSGSTDLNGSLVVSGTVNSTMGFSGSLTKLSDGTSAFVGGNGILITSSSNGPVTSAIDNSVVATISGSAFSGPVKFNSGLSGSLTKLTDGSSYLIAGDNISIVTGSNGSLTITSSISGIGAGGSLTGSYPNPTLINRPTLIWAPGKTPSDNLFSDWTSLMSAFSASKGIVNIEIDDTDPTHAPYIPPGTWDLDYRARFVPRYPGDDYLAQLVATGSVLLRNPNMFDGVMFVHRNNPGPVIELSGSIPNFSSGTPQLFINWGGVANLGSTPTIRLTNSDSIAQIVLRSAVFNTNGAPLLEMPIAGQYGSIYVEYGLQTFQGANNVVSGAAGTNLYFVYDSNIDNIPTNPNFLGTTTLYPTSNSKSIIYDDSLFTPSLGSSTVQGAIDSLKLRPQYFTSTVAGSIFTTGSAAFRGGESSVSSPSNKGSDVFFYVSGSKGIGSGKSLFGGDVVVSGTLVAKSGLSGSITNLSDGTSYLIAGSGINVVSASNGAVTLSTVTPPAPILASFSDSTVQAATLADTAYYVKYNTTEISQGGIALQNNTLGNTTRIVVPESGIYEFHYSAQLDQSVGTSNTVSFWIEKNRENGGGAVPRTNSHIELGGSVTAGFPFLAVFLTLTTGDYIELAWSSTGTGDTLNAIGTQTSPPRPENPSIIVNIKKISV